MKRLFSFWSKNAGMHFVLFFAILFFNHASNVFGQQIDLGIFATGANEIEIKMKPDVFIHQDQYIQEIRYTVRWSDPAVEINTPVTLIPPFNIELLPAEETISGGYRYQVFQVTPLFVSFGSDINVDQEVLISSFTHTGGPGVVFELVPDAMVPGALVQGEYFFQIVCNNISGPCAAIGSQEDLTGDFYAISTIPPASPVPITLWSALLTSLLIGLFVIIKPRI